MSTSWLCGFGGWVGLVVESTLVSIPFNQEKGRCGYRYWEVNGW